MKGGLRWYWRDGDFKLVRDGFFEKGIFMLSFEGGGIGSEDGFWKCFRSKE